MSSTVTILFDEPPTDMAREEILKQVAHLSRSLHKPRIPPDGSRLEFDVAPWEAERARSQAEHLCALIQRSLRQVERKVIYRTQAMSQPRVGSISAPDGDAASEDDCGIHMSGEGQVMLEGIAFELFRYFDNALAELEAQWAPRELLTPTLIPTGVLAKCDYLRSFPNTLTFACHLRPEGEILETFRAQYDGKSSVDSAALLEMAPPETCLSPAVCYHVYHRLENTRVPPDGLVYGVRGKCFRYEASNLREMMRLWDFTMRELVFLGPGDRALEARQRCVEQFGAFLDELGMAAEIRTASDPFYIAPDSAAKTYFQLTAETKYEAAVLLPEGEHLAVGSFNYHTDFFGRAFNIELKEGGYAHSACIGFGLERLVRAFLAQHGSEPGNWPERVLNSFRIREQVTKNLAI